MSTALTKQGYDRLSGFLTKPGVKAGLAAALPKHMNPDRIVRVALTAAVKTPALYECVPESVYEALLNASQLGLEPNGRDAYLVPFKDNRAGVMKCQLMPGYKGLVQLAYRSGQIDSFTAKAVYQKDHFVFRYGLHEDLDHVPCTEDDPGPLVYAWAMVRFRAGGYKFVVLNRRDIARRRACSKTANRSDSPWSTHPEAMWAKSAVHELAKWIPQTPEFQSFTDAVQMSDDAEFGTPDSITIDAPSQVTASDRLAAELGGEPQSEPIDNPWLPEEVEAYIETAKAELPGMTSLIDVDRLWATSKNGALLPPAERALVLDLIDKRKAAIRNARGERSNGA